jgi:DNA-binding NarL/FixJ family response regulator
MHTQSKKSAVFVVDDHELIRRGLSQLIGGTPDLQMHAEAGSAGEAWQVLTTLPPPDVAIIDLSLPDGNGIDLIKRLRARYPGMRMLVSSMHDEELFARRALLAGASGYINKQETAECIIDAIRQILRGRVYLSPRIMKQVFRESSSSTDTDAASPARLLSDRELEVYQLIGQGRTTAEIAATLHLSVKTIETYRAHIKRKLRLSSGAALTRSAVQWSLEQRR